MKDVGYGRGYVYAHDTKAGIAAMDCLPDALRGRVFYRPGRRGFEQELKDRMDRIAAWHARRAAADDDGREGGRTGGET
jgi:putative ATPase